MTKKLRWVASLAALAALSTALAAATAGATTTPVSVEVSGTQTVVDEANGTAAMHGSLVGVWQTTKFVPRYASSSRFVATGKEEFTGCLDSNKNGTCDKKEPSGTLKFTFMYWASFDPGDGRTAARQLRAPGDRQQRRLPQGRGSSSSWRTRRPAPTSSRRTAGTIEYQAPKSGQRRQAPHASPPRARARPAAAGACGGS